MLYSEALNLLKSSMHHFQAKTDFTSRLEANTWADSWTR